MDPVKQLSVHPYVVLIQVWVVLVQLVHEGVVVTISQSFLEVGPHLGPSLPF